MTTKIILVNLFLIFSTNAFCQIKNLWISNYYYNISRNDTIKRTILDDKIMKIENEKIIIVYFDIVPPRPQDQAYIAIETQIDTLGLKIDNNNFILISDEAIDTVSFTLTDEELILIDEKRNRKEIYAKLPKFQQASHRLKFEQFLTSSIFKIPEYDSYLEFTKNHREIHSDIHGYGHENPCWKIEEFENELFLITAGFEISIFHLEKFDKEGFNVIDYDGYDILQYRLDTLNPVKKFNKEYLIGKWEIKSENHEYPIFKNASDSLKYTHKEVLIFNDSTLINQFAFTKKISTWELNLNNEALLLPQLYEDIMRHQWSIKQLTENKLVVERRKRNPESYSDYYEIVEFSKME